VKFTVTDITACSGGGHLRFSLTVDGKPVTRQYERDELLIALANLDPRTAILARLKSYILENNLASATNTQIRTALLNKEMQV